MDDINIPTCLLAVLDSLVITPPCRRLDRASTDGALPCQSLSQVMAPRLDGPKELSAVASTGALTTTDEWCSRLPRAPRPDYLSTPDQSFNRTGPAAHPRRRLSSHNHLKGVT